MGFKQTYASRTELILGAGVYPLMGAVHLTMCAVHRWMDSVTIVKHTVIWYLSMKLIGA